MISRIARKEFTEMLRDGRFRALAAVLFVLLFLTLLVGWKHYADQSRLRAEAGRRQREQWLDKNDLPPHLAAHTGTVVFKPLQPLAAIDRGIESYVGAAAFLEAHKRNLFDHKPAEEAATAQPLGETTVATTLQLLVPLLIVLLTYASFAGEREQGTLRQLLSLGIKKRDLAVGKALGTAGPLLLLLAPAAFIGVAAIALFDDSGLLRSVPRLALMVVCYLAYFVVFLCLGLIVSARCATARRALLLLLGCWFVACLLVPRVALEIGQRVYRTPEAREFAQAIEQDQKKQPDFLARRARVIERLMKQYGVANARDLPISPYGTTLYEAEEEETRTYEKHFNRLFENYERQNRLYQTAALLTPIVAAQAVSMGLAGSDWNHHRRFADATEQYRRVLVQTMNRVIIERGAEDQYSLAGREVYERVPPFSYAAPGLKWSLAQVKLPLALLALWLIGAGLITPLALSKLRVD